MFSWLICPVLGGLKLPRRPCTIKPFLKKSQTFRTMPKGGLMNDAWLGRSNRPKRDNPVMMFQALG
jgi:hypothetical protein